MKTISASNFYASFGEIVVVIGLPINVILLTWLILGQYRIVYFIMSLSAQLFLFKLKLLFDTKQIVPKSEEISATNWPNSDIVC